jgi:hypothetical protein
MRRFGPHAASCKAIATLWLVLGGTSHVDRRAASQG